MTLRLMFSIVVLWIIVLVLILYPFKQDAGKPKIFPAEWAQPEIACVDGEHGAVRTYLATSTGRDLAVVFSFTCSGGFPRFKVKESK